MQFNNTPTWEFTRRMVAISEFHELKLSVGNNGEAARVFGLQDENLRYITTLAKAKIVARGNELSISGTEQDVTMVANLFRQLAELATAGMEINARTINYLSSQLQLEEPDKQVIDALKETIYVNPKGKHIRVKTLGQSLYIQELRRADLVFAIGPAGTGKTYLAVVEAVSALRRRDVERIILARPAVEAGEKLGFLPGDLQEKVNPYLRPLYDALDDVLGQEVAQRYLERQTIELAPLAYMRGRTLDNAFIILDEAQNTTPEQMKMFLTRLGADSRAVITGDITQVDLPRGQVSGLLDAQRLLQGIEGISFVYLADTDVIRHPLVRQIVRAYAAH